MKPTRVGETVSKKGGKTQSAKTVPEKPQAADRTHATELAYELERSVSEISGLIGMMEHWLVFPGDAGSPGEKYGAGIVELNHAALNRLDRAFHEIFTVLVGNAD